MRGRAPVGAHHGIVASLAAGAVWLAAAIAAGRRQHGDGQADRLHYHPGQLPVRCGSRRPGRIRRALRQCDTVQRGSGQRLGGRRRGDDTVDRRRQRDGCLQDACRSRADKRRRAWACNVRAYPPASGAGCETGSIVRSDRGLLARYFGVSIPLRSAGAMRVTAPRQTGRSCKTAGRAPAPCARPPAPHETSRLCISRK